MAIKNPNNVGRKLARVKSVQLPGKTEIKEVRVEVIKEVEIIKEVPVSNITAEKRAHEAESKLAEALATIERMKRPEPAIEQNGKEEPPEEIADLFDPSLTPRQNQEKLQKLYIDLMNERELYMSYNDDKWRTKATKVLERAQRIESGINWNRAVHAEVF